MNKNQYRLVFSRVRGMLVAVEETAHATGKVSKGEAPGAVANRVSSALASFALRHAAFAVLIAAGVAPMWASAQVVGAGANAPSVIQTQNGLQQVNITKPSGAGVSLNTYSQFDVPKQGVIVNNSPTLTNTQQAGYINGNPNLSPNGSARIIINQVNSSNPSQLKGFVEIAGQRAEMIISNPSGLVVDGGGFINTSRAILTTGTPNLNADGSLAGFSVTRGLIAVQGAGLNATNVDQVDLISRAVQANAAIYATNLNVITGANQVNHDTLQATRIQGDGAAPAVAIDVAQLGGMYSNRILLVGTEGGVGVRNAGTIAADAMGLTLTTDGRLIQSGTISSTGNAAISAAGGVENSGTTYGQQSVSVNTGADVVNTGTLAAQHNVGVTAGTLNSTGLLGAGVNSDGAVTQAGDLQLATTGQLNATGKNVAGGNVSATGAGVNLAGGTTAANGNLSLNATAGDVNLTNATTSAQGAIAANATGTVINDHGSLTSGGAATLTAGNVSNQGGTVSSQGPLSVMAAGQLANQSGVFVSQNTMALQGGTIANNQGTIQSAGRATVDGTTIDNTAGRITSLNTDGLVLNATGQLTNAAGTTANGAQGGVIGGNGEVTVQGGTIVNHATITSNTNLHVSGQSVDNNSGSLQAAQNVVVDAGAHLTNTGGTIAGQTAVLSGTTLDNSAGTVQAQQVALTGTSLINHGGTITQTGTGAMAVNVSGTLDNSSGGTLQTNSTDLTLAPAALVNDGGTIVHAGTGTLTLGNGAGSVSNVGGAIASNGHIAAQSGSLNNSSGSINAQSGLTATVGGTLNNTNGKLLSNTAVGLTSGTLTNDGGQIGASTNATIHTGSMTNRGGVIVAPTLTVTADSTLDNSGGQLAANQLALTTPTLTNHGGTITQYGSSAMGVNVSGTLDNSAGGVIQTNSTDLTLAPAQLNNAGGTITHAGTGTLTIEPGNGASALNNAGGTIVTKGNAVVDASNWDNTSGILAAQGGITGTVAGDVNNSQGLVRAGTSLSLTNGGALVNQGGHIQAGQTAAGDTSTLSIQSASINNADGSIADLGAGKMTVQGGSQITNSHAGGVSGMGAITGNGDVTVNAASISNTQGGQLSGASLHVQGTTLDNSGGQIGNVANSSGDVDVTTSGAITNTNGQISSTHDLTVTAPTLQGGGTYSAAHDANVNLQGDFSVTPDYQFNVGHNLAFTLPGTFNNSGNVQSVNDLSVNAGTIVNSGALSAGGLLHTQSGNLTNTGAIVGGSTSLNATGTVSNLGPTALIGASDSNGTLEILANDIENRDDTTATDSTATTAIFGMGKVVLAGGKDASGNYTNAALINNSSALIQSGGDMELHANQITNTRRVMTTSTGSVDPATLAPFGVPIKGQTGQVGVKDPTSIGGVYTDPPHGGQWNSTYQYTTYYADSATATTVTGISPGAQIASGGNIDASSVGSLKNYWSSITAVGNIAMPQHYDGDGWAATGQQAPSVTVSYSGQYHYNNYDNSEYNWQLPFGNAPFVTSRPGGYTQAAPASVKQYSLPDYHSTLGSNGTISGTGVSINNTAANASIPSLGLLPGQVVPGLTIGGLSGNASGTKSGASAVHGGVTTVSPVIASATAQNVLNNLTIPQGGLYRPDTSPTASYVIETNPAFTNQKKFISSDYFFSQIGVDLTHIPKRLGDGFYEQQLVRNQVTSLTGKAVLGPYTDLQAMYESLMAAGATLEKQLNLPIGASLSADQVSKLTSNVIMMETRVVDGQSVLVPVVYLAHASQQNVNGPLITATDIDLQDAQNFTNSGTVKADNTLSIQGKQIDNAFGALQSGGLMALATTGNVDLTSAQVKAGSLYLNAGGDLILNTAVKTDTRVSRDGATSVTTTLGPTAQLDVAGDAGIKTGGNFQQNAGNLTVGGNLGMNVGGNWDLGAVQTGEHKIVQRANGVSNTAVNNVVGSSVKVSGQSSIGVGGDLTAKGAQIDLGQGGTIAAKGNVTLGAASATSTVNSNSSGSDSHGSYAETMHTSDQALTGTTLKGGDTVTLASGKDLTISGSTISLDKGNANLLAAGDVNIGAATEAHELNSHETHSHSNVVSGAKIASGTDQTATYSQGSTVSADGVNIVSNRDINVTGSNVVGTNDVTLQATRDVNIKTSQDTTQSSTYYEKKESGLLTNGGLSVTVGSRSTAQQDLNSSVTNNGSVIGSSQGNVTIQAGKDATITGSTVVAGQDIGISGQNVTVNAAYDNYKDSQSQQFSQSGLSVGLGGGLVGLGQSMASAVRQGQQSGDSRLAAVQGVAAAEQAYQNRGGIKDAANALSNGNVSEAAKGVQVQISIGSSHSSSNSTTSITDAKGSSIIGNGNVSITATGTPDANGNAQTGTGNIAMTGATVLGKNVALDANNAITLQSAQSTEQNTSSNSSSGWNAGVAIGVGKNTGISVFANGSNAHGQGNGSSVTQTNTTVAAGNTLSMTSGGDTTLAGVRVSGDKVKADVGGNLTMTSLQDTSNYSSNQHNAGVSGSFTFGYGGGVDASIGHTSVDANYASVNQQTGIVAGKEGFDVNVAGHTQLDGAQIASAAPADKNTLTTGSLGFTDIQNKMSYSGKTEGFSTSGGPSFAQTGDNASGVTHAAVSPGKIVVKSDQQSGTDSTVGLSRDTANANQTVQNTFNLQKVQNDLAFAQAFGKAATFAVAEAATQLENSSPQMKALFGEGGAGRDVLHAAVAAIGAALSGGNIGGAVAGSLTGDLLQSLAQPIIDQAVAQLPLSAQAAARNALNEIVATAGGAAGGALAGGGSSGALAGAGSAINNELYNRQLHVQEVDVVKKLAQQKAQEVCRGDASCVASATIYWTDMLERVAKGLVDDTANKENMAYLQALIRTANNPTSEGAMGGLSSYLTNMQTAEEMLSQYMGKPILVRGLPMISDGSAQTYFSATPAQRSDQYLNSGLGSLPDPISRGASQRDQDRLNSFATQNGSVKPDYTIEETVVGGILTNKLAATAARVGESIDVWLAGSVSPTNKGFISTGKVTMESMPVKLNSAEQGVLSQLDQLPSTELQGQAREYVANNYFVRNGFTPLNGKCGVNCFDGVYIKGDTVYINEVKPLNATGSIQLNGPSGSLPTQMSDKWIDSAVTRLRNGDASQRATADLIQKAIDSDKLVKVVTGVNSNGATLVKLK
ncbi:contact-dependent inhibition toxin BcpA [Burkholderia latens]|uniref:Filamentous hemagglutinin n=1 Tax=Burkholderia latens TaxID=488446 RepID=A0A6H9TLW8_9BURK|nr:contact-dependent inhibition toxin BcpA [Burkholderia latens]KAB0644776.1 filamentous hemagglutinin N-terminal domain-containing protein [Burkholderia latens]VWB17733.1 filamentous hemagglutinin [Burkholderia latens]